MADLTFSEAPYSQEAEEAVIGAVLINPNSYLKAAEQIEAGDFFFIRNAYIWQAIARLHDRQDAIDALTVCNELSGMGKLIEVGGPAYLTQTMNNTPTSIHAEVYAGIVKRAAVRRQLMKTADEIKVLAGNESLSIEEVQQRSSDKLLAIPDMAQNRVEHIDPMLNDHLDMVQYAIDHGTNQIMGVPSGITQLDSMLQGFQKRKLYVIGGAPHNGKTSTMLTCALNAAKSGAKVLFFNVADGDKVDVLNRLIAMESGISPHKIGIGALDQKEYNLYVEVIANLAKLNIFIHSEKGMSMRSIWEHSRRISIEHGVDIVFIDYIQRITVGNDLAKTLRTNWEQQAHISQRLTVLGDVKHLNCPVVVGAQISRDGRHIKKPPTMNAIKGCGNIEEDADGVILTWYEAVANKNAEYKDRLSLIVEKNKITGQLGTVQTRIDKTTTRLHNWPANAQRHNPHVDFNIDHSQGGSSEIMH